MVKLLIENIRDPLAFKKIYQVAEDNIDLFMQAINSTEDEIEKGQLVSFYSTPGTLQDALLRNEKLSDADKKELVSILERQSKKT
jgi:hypothetical protein